MQNSLVEMWCEHIKDQDPGQSGYSAVHNHQDEIVRLRKEKAVGVLDLRSVGYFKVGYQKMVNIVTVTRCT